MHESLGARTIAADGLVQPSSSTTLSAIAPHFMPRSRRNSPSFGGPALVRSLAASPRHPDSRFTRVRRPEPAVSRA